MIALYVVLGLVALFAVAVFCIVLRITSFGDIRTIE